VLLAVAVLAGCGSTPAAPRVDAPVQSSAAEPTLPSPVPAGPGTLRLSLPGGPDWLAADDRFVYVRRDAGVVDKVDPATGAVLASIEVPGDPCQGLGVAFGSVWTCRGREVLRLDFDAGVVTASIAADKAPIQGTLAGGADRLWVLAGDGSRLVGIDPVTNTVDPPIELGVRGTDIAVGEGAVWVVSHLGLALVRVDLASRQVTARVDGIGAVYSVAVGEGAVWASGRTTVRVAADTPEATAIYEAGTGLGGALAVEGGTVLVRNQDEFLQEIDVITGEVRSFSPRPEGDRDDEGGDVMVAFGSVWVTDNSEGVLLRMDRR
jgi:hypothetical protein